MKNNKKTISIIIKINKKNTHRPDAGHWIFDELNNQWVENIKLIEEMQSFYTLLRKEGKNKNIFHVDSFPKQGNTTLRSILLDVFPEMVMPDPMSHVTAFTKCAINNGEVVISTLRDPHDSLTSFISMGLISGRYDNHISSNTFKHAVREAVLFYNRYLDFLIENYNEIYFVHFDQILEMYSDHLCFREQDNQVLKYLSEKYDLEFIQYSKQDQLKYSRRNAINYDSSTDKKIKQRLITNKYYLRKIKKSYKLYMKILKMIGEDKKYEHVLGA